MSGMNWSEVFGLRVDVYRSVNATKTAVSLPATISSPWSASSTRPTAVGSWPHPGGGKAGSAPPPRRWSCTSNTATGSTADNRPRNTPNLTPLELDPDKPAVYYTAHSGNYAGGSAMFSDPIEALLGYPPGHVLPVHDHNPF